MNGLQQLFEEKDYQRTTDKGSVHTYLERYYGKEFEDKRDSFISILEIGVFTGGSLALFSEWMPNATIVGIDVEEFSKECIQKNVWGIDTKNITVYTKDAYNRETVSMFDDNSLDYIVEDGSHVIGDVLFVVKHWLDKIKKGGKLIIEDVQSLDWYEQVQEIALEKGAEKITIFDLRTSEGSRYDDIVIEIQK